MALRRSLLQIDNVFIRNILQFKDKEFRIHIKLFAIVEEVDV